MQSLVSPVPRDLTNPVLGRAIRSSRAAVRDALFTSGPLRNPTLLLDVLSEALIDRCAQALADGDVAAFVDWSAATCTARAGVPAVRTMFLSIGKALKQSFDDAWIDELERALVPAIGNVAVSEAGIPNDTVDQLDVMLADLVVRIESNDPMTAEHCRAVSAWCGRIASALQLTRAEALFVARGGLIHDVGKSKTPADILRAPRKLTDDEWFVMKEHVTAGYEIVRDHPQLRAFGGLVRSHHERVDGRGYPDGLERDGIPIAVRIVTVADAFNAMIGRRAYRVPLSPDVAALELRRHAGTQFDTAVVDALIDVVGGTREHLTTQIVGGAAC